VEKTFRFVTDRNKNFCDIWDRELREDDEKYRNLDGGIDLVDGEDTAQLLGKFLNL
jgi:hypothetical protein